MLCYRDDSAEPGGLLLAIRGPGSFLAEELAFERDGMMRLSMGMHAGAAWQTSARAKGEVTVLQLHYSDLAGLISQFPEVAGDVRAGGFTCDSRQHGSKTINDPMARERTAGETFTGRCAKEDSRCNTW